MTDYRLPIHPHHAPSRKPLPGMHSGYPAQPYDGLSHQQQLSPHPSSASLAHSRSRTSSSNVLPYVSHQQSQYVGGPSPHSTMSTPSHYPPSRRLSSATTSTTSTTGNNPMNFDIRRSTSCRSGGGQLGYVALMRRQKATVWCDRAQPEDPRLRAQKVADKKRAYLEVHGAGHKRPGPQGKNKHSGKGTTDFSPSTLVGAKVPVRLSANEVGDGDEDTPSDGGFPYGRTGSGRSSLGSSRYPSGYQRPTPQGTMGSNSSPPNEKNDLPEVSEHPPAEVQEQEKDSGYVQDDGQDDDANSIGSEHEDKFGTVGDMGAPSAVLTAAEKAMKADELRRRGSVDERTTSMTNVRLFVANPDLSD